MTVELRDLIGDLAVHAPSVVIDSGYGLADTASAQTAGSRA